MAELTRAALPLPRGGAASTGAASGGRGARVTAQPYALVLHGGSITCVAHDVDRAVPRAFVFDRMSDVEAREASTSSCPPTSRSADWLQGDFGVARASRTVKVLVEFEPRVADGRPRAKGPPVAEGRRRAPDGRVRVVAAACPRRPRCWPACERWLLGFGSAGASSSRGSWPARWRPSCVALRRGTDRSQSARLQALLPRGRRDRARTCPSLSLSRSSHDDVPIVPKKPPVDADALAHRDLRRGPLWQKIPAYRAVDEATFLDHAWQAKNSITKVAKLVETIQELVPPGFIEDLESGMKRAPMSVRVSPYLVSLIDWEHPYEDPLRTSSSRSRSRLLARPPQARARLARTSRPTRPCPGSPTATPTRRSFCRSTRARSTAASARASYAIGLDTDEVEKVHLRPNDERWQRAYQYIASRPELEDIVISGGDAYQLRAQHIEEIGEALLGHPERAAHALRDQGSGGDAA